MQCLVSILSGCLVCFWESKIGMSLRMSDISQCILCLGVCVSGCLGVWVFGCLGVCVSGVHLNEIWWKHLADEVHQGVWCCHIPALHLRVPLQTNVKTYFISASNKRSQKKQVNLDCFLVLIRLTFWTFPIQISI